MTRAMTKPIESSLTLENESLKKERDSAVKAGEIQTLQYHCRKKLSSCYLDIYDRVLKAVQVSNWGSLPIIPIKLEIQLDVDAMPGARETVGDHLRSKYGIRLMEITFERPGRV